MDLQWYLNRLSRMTPGEMSRRVRDQTVKFRWRSRQVRDMAGDPLEVPSALPPLASALSPDVAERLPEPARSKLIETADQVVAGRWWIFDRLREDLVPEPDWFLDPLTGMRAPVDRNALKLNYRHEDEVGNIKYVWELSRHHHVTILAAAYFVTGDERYAETAAAQLTSWWNANPFLTGIHWTSGIELGVRLIAWIWARRLLDGWSGAQGLFEGNPVFLKQLHRHLDYLATFPSYGSSSNNHILAEAAGQFAACCAFPYFPETARWRRQAAKALRREIPAQTFDLGLNREMATDYQGFVMELCLAAALEGEAAGESLGVEVWRQIRNMTDALAAMVDVRGRPPRQGDADDGIGLLLDAPGYKRWAALLNTGAELFGPCDWWPPVSRDDARTPFWTALGTVPRELGTRPAARPAHFEDAGMVLMRASSDTADEIWCRCDHGPHGFLSIAAHAHADALSIELRHGGIDILADPGTLCYQGEPDWRAITRATVGHNTLELAGVDQSVSGGEFLWTKQARSTLEHVSGLADGPVAEWRASHDGYARLSPPAVHRRSVTFHRDLRQVVVDDSVECQGRHPCRLAFHLGPEVDCKLSGHTAKLTWSDGVSEREATLELPPSLEWEQFRGETAPPLGWYAQHFRDRTPATTLLGVGDAGEGQHLVTQIQFKAETGLDQQSSRHKEEASAV